MQKAMPVTELINKAYRLFNTREVDELLLMMTPRVEWPNGWEGGWVQGRDAVRDYWYRQWKELNPVVNPLKIRELPDKSVEVVVHQLVKDLAGQVIADAQVKHVYFFEEGLIGRMEIRE